MQLNYRQRGEGFPLVLIHGMFGSLDNLNMVAKPLSEPSDDSPGYSVISVDVRNHGTSPHADSMTYAEMAKDVEQLLEHLGIEQAHFLGHSMGGKIAMQIASNHPEKIAKLIIADMAPVTYPSHHTPVLDGLSALSNALLESRNQADEILKEFVEEAGVRAFLLKNLQREEDGKFGLKLNLPAILDSYENLRGSPLENPFIGPTLFIKGGNSNYITDAHREEVLHWFPNAELKVIPGTGHWLHAEKPKSFNSLVRRFLAAN